MNRAHVIRLNPTPEQASYFRKACGVARHCYNWALAQWKQARAEGRRVKMKDLKREYNRIKREQFPWALEVTKCAAEQEFSHLSAALTTYFRMKEEGTQPKLKHPRKDGEEAGFPRYKSKKHDRLSFYLNNDKFHVEGHWLSVPKLGKVNMTEELRLCGRILSGTIFEQAGQWFVSISVDVAHVIPTHRGGTVGIDLGIKVLATTSEGEEFENQRHYRRNLGRIKGLSKGLSRKQEGSQNWWKNSTKLARAHYSIGNQRKDSLHKMTTSIAKNYALIGLEDLNAKGMLANHCLAQAVSDASFFEVKRQLLYKSEQHGGYVQLIDRWFASSKTCHHCRWVKEDLRLSDRAWDCERCGAHLLRDSNAAHNVKNEAIRLMTGVPVVASSGQKFACGAGRSGLMATSGETPCCEAGTEMASGVA
jgi:putative transposase